MPRQRSKKNKNARAGTANCQWGICKKGNDLSETYNVDVVVVTRRPDGFIGGFQSRPGLMRELFEFLGDDDLFGPSQFKGGRHGFLNTLRPSPSPPAHPSPPPSTSSSLSDLPSSEHLSDFPATPSMFLLSPSPWDDIEAGGAFACDTMSLEDDMPTQLVCPASIMSGNATPTSQRDTPTPTAVDTEDSGALNILQPTPVSMRKKQAILSLLDEYL